jgi:HEAT repeat protein
MSGSGADLLFADVARIRLELDAKKLAQLDLSEDESTFFGSGRLIGRNLVLTARHVLESGAGRLLPVDGWEIRLVCDQVEPGRWVGEPLAARVIWRGVGGLDLALLELVRCERDPTLVRFRLGPYDAVENLQDCWVAGFPWAAREDPTRARPYGFPALLRTAVLGGPYRLTVDIADAPKEPVDWRGVSGGCVVKWRGDVVWLLGAVQHVPKAFGAGALDVARLDEAWTDARFIGNVLGVCSLRSLDLDAEVRKRTIRALNQFGPAAVQAVPKLITALSDTDREVRKTATDLLLAIGPTNAVPALVTAFDNLDSRVRRRIAETFALFGPTAAEAVPALIKALDDIDTSVRQGTVGALSAMGPAAAEAVPALINALRDDKARRRWDDINVRTAAKSALGRIGPAAVPALFAALGDATDAEVRKASAEALGNIGPAAAEAVPALLAARADADWYLRLRAVEALGRIGSAAPEVVPALIATLRDGAATRWYGGEEKGLVSEAAAQALGQFGSAAVEAVPALIDALTDAVAGVRLAAAHALCAIGLDAVPRLIAALREVKAPRWVKGGATAETRRAAAQVLREIGPQAAEAVPALISALGDTDAGVREAATDALSAIGPPSVPALLAALRNVKARRWTKWRLNAEIRQAVVRALGQIGPPAVPALITALGDPNQDVRRGTAEALGQIGSPAVDAMPALTTALGDADVGVSRAAGEALGRVRPASA